MKNILFALVGIIALSSCKKEEVSNPGRFPIPTQKQISTDALDDARVDVQWETTDGRNGTFQSQIGKKSDLGKGTKTYTVNGSLQSQSGTGIYQDKTKPMIVIIMNTDKSKVEVYALKPFFHGENQTWNSMAEAPIGVQETASEIIITSNNMKSPDDNHSMCVRLSIKK